MEERSPELVTLNTVATAISSSLELPKLFETLRDVLSQEMNIPAGAVFSYDPNEDRLSLEVGWGLDSAALVQLESLPASAYHDERVIQDKVPVIKSCLPKAGPFSTLGISQPEWQGHLAIPLVAKEELHGVADLFTRSPPAPSGEQMTLLATLGRQVGVALQNARLFEQVRAGRERLRKLSQELVEVQEAERRHIARELHDQIGQMLTGLKLVLEMSIRRQTDAQQASLEEAIGIVEDLIIRVREMSLDLRPAMLDDLGLLPTLLWHFERYSAQTRVQVKFEYSGVERRFPPETETVAYRIVQEALTNVARHAGVNEVMVRMWGEEDRLGIQVEDRGRGFNPQAMPYSGESRGLAGMRERATLMGGQLEIESTPGLGTRITAELPLRAWIERRSRPR